jgi:hypothetical protein
MSIFGLGLGQPNHALAFFELTALFHQLDPLKALQNAALGFNGALALQAGMLAHRGGKSGPNPRKSNLNRSASPLAATVLDKLTVNSARLGVLVELLKAKLAASVSHGVRVTDRSTRSDRGGYTVNRIGEMLKQTLRAQSDRKPLIWRPMAGF